MTSLEEFLYPTQKKLFKRLCKKFKGKTLISKGNFILVYGQAPVMLNGINLSDAVIKAHRRNITAMSEEESVVS